MQTELRTMFPGLNQSDWFTVCPKAGLEIAMSYIVALARNYLSMSKLTPHHEQSL
jgi:hypothetical protein